MKKLLCLICALVLCMSTMMATVAFAGTNAATCDEDDGGEMIYREETTKVFSRFRFETDGSVAYLYRIYSVTVTKFHQCTVNPDHRYIIDVITYEEEVGPEIIPG